jgi:hypothetical protein
MSILDDYFMMKFDFYEDVIPKYSKVKFITIINNACLVEDIKTNQRKWVMKYDIYPLCDRNKLNVVGDWSYSQFYDEIAKENNLKS